MTCDARPLPAKRATPAASAPPSPAVQAARKAAAQKALRRVPRIEKAVSKLRGLPFKKPVPALYQSAGEFREQVHRNVGLQISAQQGKDMGRALFHVGMFQEEQDLTRMVADATASQVGAYYDPQEGKFFVVMVTGDDLMFDGIVAHELTHAVQDQHFGLAAYLGIDRGGSPVKGLSGDALSARRFIVEGEATLVMMAHTLSSRLGNSFLAPESTSVARAALRGLTNINAAQLREMVQSQMAQGSIDEDLRSAVESMEDIPPYVLIPLLGAYLQGTRSVHETYVARGWDGVADLYAHPPESTEQVLHPETKLLAERDMPVKLALPAAPSGVAGARELMRDTLGELGWRAYFETWCTNDLQEAAAGWDGDTVAVYETGASALGVITTTWDTDMEALEFLDAYTGTLSARFPGSKVEIHGERAQVKRPDGTLVLVERRGADVLVVDGATRPDQIELGVPTSRE